MGISGLLPLLKSIQRPTELKKFHGETLAVDAYGWLHRGAICCASELAQGKPTRRYVDSTMNRVRMVQHFGVTPYLVFDGDFLPSKAATEASRAKRREASCKAGMELAKAGNAKQAFLEFQKAVDVTPEMARELIEELKKLGLPYVVAPYEADAQMVYLERQGHVSGILSEDSDLLVFGAKRLLTKLDMHGHCIEINRRDFCAVREIALTDWTDCQFRQMAILSGCDYLDGIGNLGLKTAYRLIRKHKTIEKVVRMLQFDGKFKVSENYLAAFRQAELTFLHQRVFCPKAQQLVLLTEPTSGLDVEEMLFIGRKVDDKLAQAIAVGDVNPITKNPIIPAPSPGKKRSASNAGMASSSNSNSNSNMRGSPAPRFGSSSHSQPSQTTPVGLKPINSYFGKRQNSAQRIPLGGMDPNCFAVDRQQVAALTQNGLAPRVFPLPRPYVDGGRASLNLPNPSPPARDGLRLRRRQTEPLARMLQLTSPTTSPSGSSASRNSNHRPTTATMQVPQPASTRPLKKARLSQHGDSGGSPKQRLGRSKYFPVASAPAGEVSLTPSADDKCGGRADAFLMSDDSVDDAMRTLSALEEWNSTAEETVCIFDDTQVTEHGSLLDQVIPESPAVQKRVSRKGSQVSVPASDDAEEQTVDDIFRSNRKSAKNRGTPVARVSLQRFSYGQGTQVAHGLPTPDSSFSQAAVQTTMLTKASSLTPPMTNSLRRPKDGGRSLSSTLGDSCGVSASLCTPLRPEKQHGRKPTARLSGAVNPSFIPLPPADLAEVEALHTSTHQGSEDQIIPDSDAEDEAGEFLDTGGGGLPVEGDSTPSRLDLSRFVCGSQPLPST